jgi:short-subunit dehydrogenase
MNRSLRTALVTGGSTGLGYHVAQCLAERHYHVTIIGRDSEKLAASVKQFPGSQHRWIALDLSNREQMEELVLVVERQGFDVLVNNAGASRFGSVATLDAATVERLLWLNFMTPACLSAAFLRTAKPDSVLVNVTSIVGTLPVPGNALYSAAKAGLQALTECMWYEMKSQHVRVIDFRPVSLRTGFHRAAGGESMSSPSIAVEPFIAARDLVNAIENKYELVYNYGVVAILLDWAKRLLPSRLRIQIMGRQSREMMISASSKDRTPV